MRRADGRGSGRNVRFLVDSGAIYFVLPENVWRPLRLTPERQVEFTLADGTTITRGVSECRFEIRGHAATSPVVLGENHDGALLGAVTLETLGLMLNPLTREILPMRMALSRVHGPIEDSSAFRLCGLKDFSWSSDYPVISAHPGIQVFEPRSHTTEGAL
ncbi:MAG TPA: retroviral-like aspartic protease family protein [Candidatus Binatia bacterium]